MLHGFEQGVVHFVHWAARGVFNSVDLWAFERDWCQYSDQIGEHDPAPIRITKKEFVGLENWCTVTQLNAVAGEMVLDLACEGEGIASSDRIYLRVEGDSLKIRRAGEETLQYHRCE